MKFYTLSLLIIFSVMVKGDPPSMIWNKAFGGTNIDVGHAIDKTSDGGYIITGYTRSFGTMSGRNVWLIKTDPLGNEVWQKTFGGNNDEEAYSVKETADKGFIIAGYTKSFGAGLNDIYVIKTDSAGNEVWQKTFGGTLDEEAFSIIQASDGNFVVAGVTSSFAVGGRDVWLSKINNSGIEIWRRSLGGLGSDGARSLEETSDGGLILTGWTFSYGPGNIGNLWLVKTDSSGMQQWHKFFGGTGVDRGYSVKEVTDKGFIVTGYTSSFGFGLDDLLLIRTDSLGNEIWNKSFGGTGRDYGHSVIQTSEGGFLSAGYTLSSGAGGDDFYLVKTDIHGNLEWSKTFGGGSSDIAYGILETHDGGTIIVGHTLSYGAGVHDVWLVKTSTVVPVELISFSGYYQNGTVSLEWSTASEVNNLGFEIERKINGQQWESLNFIKGNGTLNEISRYSYFDKINSSGLYCYRLKQIDYDGTVTYFSTIEVNAPLPDEMYLYNNYPNPFNPVTKIKFYLPESLHTEINIYNSNGEEVAKFLNKILSEGYHELLFDASDLSSGIYFYTLKAGDKILRNKMIYLK
jgi:hypothetical protein